MQLLKCPSCGTIAEAYDIQIAGKASLVCGSCSWHGYSSRTPYVIRDLPIINIDRYLVKPRLRSYENNKFYTLSTTIKRRN